MQQEVQFRREVYREDVEKMADWMADEKVIRHLNEDQNIDRRLHHLLAETNLPLFSPQFNSDGCFFLVTLPGEGPIGFLRLVAKGEKAEIVVVIGERRYWGNGVGRKAIKKGLRHAFYEWRKDKVVATIHHENNRSRRVFRKAGFERDRELASETRFSMKIDQFLGIA